MPYYTTPVSTHAQLCLLLIMTANLTCFEESSSQSFNLTYLAQWITSLQCSLKQKQAHVHIAFISTFKA